MRHIYIITISLILASCGPSQEAKNIAAVTCSIMGETRNMDAAVRVEKMNDARKEIGGEPFLKGDSVIKEAFEYGLCEELVLGTYDEVLNSMREEARLAWEAGAEDRKIAEEKQAEENRIAEEKQAEENRIAEEKQEEENRIAEEKKRISDAKPSVKEEYYVNGKLRKRTNYQSVNDGGKKHGLEEFYGKNGQLDRKTNYKDGKKDGLEESYYENGQLDRKTNYKDGKKDGLEESYGKNGQLYYKNNYKDGKLDGPGETYFENGELAGTLCYKNGEIVFKTGEITDDSYCKPQ